MARYTLTSFVSGIPGHELRPLHSLAFERAVVSLVELAISVGMATFVVLGMYGIFTIQTQQAMNQDMRMEMHQNGRFALEYCQIHSNGRFGSRGTIVGVMGAGEMGMPGDRGFL